MSTCRFCKWQLVVPALLVLSLIGSAGAAASVESDVRNRTIEALRAAGLAGVTVADVALRDVTVKGPGDLEDDVFAVLAGVHAIGATTFVAAAESPFRVDQKVTKPVDVIGVISNRSLTLFGTVPDSASDETLVLAAEEVFTSVVSELVHVGGSPTPTAANAIDQIAALMPDLADLLVEGRFDLHDEIFEVSGRTRSDVSRATLTARILALSGLDSSSRLTASGEAPRAAVLEVTIASTLRASPVSFENGSATINGAGKNALDTVALILDGLAGDPTLSVQIECHVGTESNDIENLNLSQARADAVVAYLVDQGVRSTALTAIGYGNTRPTAGNGIVIAVVES